MKITYEFTDDDDRSKIEILQKASDFYLALCNIYNEVYAFNKWGAETDDGIEFRQKALALIASVLDDIAESGYHSIS